MKIKYFPAGFGILILSQAALYAQNNADTTYVLPEVLKTGSGKVIQTTKQWEQERRPEILGLFKQHVYGKTPEQKLKLRFVTRNVSSNALHNKATRKEVRIFFSQDTSYYMDMLMYLPNKVKQPVPLFLGLNFGGNQVIDADPGITISKRWITYGEAPQYINHFSTEHSRGSQRSDWPVENILDAGYGLATVYYGDLQPDSANSVNAGIAPLFYRQGQTQPADNEWGAIGVWAWGLSRAMDYLQTDKAINSKQIALVGHSRLGKAALWAGAQDKRFAIVISNNSGEGGAAITRRKYGETIAIINKAFPHWFSANFKQFNNRENSLPVDFHQLIALIAPRPVYIASASEDQWADPTGEYLSGFYATPAYALYGLQGLESPVPPAIDHPTGNGAIGYHLRQGEHAMTHYDWEQYLHFADRFFRNNTLTK